MYCLQCAREGIICDAPCSLCHGRMLGVCLTTALKVALTRGKEEEKHSDINGTNYRDVQQWYDVK